MAAAAPTTLSSSPNARKKRRTESSKTSTQDPPQLLALDALLQESDNDEDAIIKELEEDISEMNSRAFDLYQRLAKKLTRSLVLTQKRLDMRTQMMRDAIDEREEKIQTQVEADIGAVNAQIAESRKLRRREREEVGGVDGDGRFSSKVRRSGGFPAGTPSGTYISPTTLYSYMQMVRQKYVNHPDVKNKTDDFFASDPDFIPAWFDLETGSCVTGGFSPAALRAAPFDKIYVGETRLIKPTETMSKIPRLNRRIVVKLEQVARYAQFQRRRRLERVQELIERFKTDNEKFEADIVEYLSFHLDKYQQWKQSRDVDRLRQLPHDPTDDYIV